MAHSPATVRVAKAAIRMAIKFKCPDLGCLDCGRLPDIPIACHCGHTRCYECVAKSLYCPCGSMYLGQYDMNIWTRNIVKKIDMVERSPSPASLPSPEASSESETSESELENKSSQETLILEPMPKPIKKTLRHRRCNARNCRCFSQKERIKHALDLMRLREYKEAVPHLAHAAATTMPSQNNDRRYAYKLLLKCVREVLSARRRNERTLIREICHKVRAKCKNLLPNVELSDLECPICLDVMASPVTTPCGHTFCRMCIIRTLENQKYCALCRSPLDDLTIVLTSDTSFVTAVLELAKPLRAPVEPESQFIPIFRCTVAFPTIPCPILILGSYHRKFIRRILDSGTRRFGMVTTHKDGTLALSGTIVEVRDCVQLQDGRTILSTVGITRFRTLNRKNVKQDRYVAQVLPIKDITPTENEIENLHFERLAQSITDKMVKWLTTLRITILTDIQEAFGPMPLHMEEDRWWMNPECPKWLWWIIAILPFGPDLQVLMLATKNLHKRMLAVSRTLEVIKDSGLHPSIFY